MSSADIYEMIEVIMGQPPFNLHEDDGRRCELIFEVVRHVSEHHFAQALREVAAEHSLVLDYDEVYADDGDDGMDGDHASALASCGFGTDEDYGCYGGGDWWFFLDGS